MPKITSVLNDHQHRLSEANNSISNSPQSTTEGPDESFFRIEQLVQIAKQELCSQPTVGSVERIFPIAALDADYDSLKDDQTKVAANQMRTEAGANKRPAVRAHRGAVRMVDEELVVRSHSWGPRAEDNYDESTFPDGYMVRRERDGSTFERFRNSDHEQFFALRKSDGRTFYWKGISRNGGDVGIQMVESLPVCALTRYNEHHCDIGIKIDSAACILASWVHPGDLKAV